MLEPLFPRAALTLLWSALTIFGIACSKQSKTVKIPQKPLAVPSTPTMVDSAVSGEQASSRAKPLSNQITKETVEPTSFEMGLDKASGGFSVSQSARSSEDWQLVADYYQDAINLMKSVRSQSRYYSIAKVKAREYQRHLDYALEKSVDLRQPIPDPEPERIVVTVPPLKESIAKQSIAPQKMQVPRAVQKILKQNLQSQPSALPQQLPTSLPQSEPPQSPPTPRQPIPIPVDTQSVYAAVPIEKKRQVRAFSAPIKRRIGGTPIIDVTFNGQQRFEMIVDTGASGTVITQRMANLLGVTTVGKAKANTASAQSVEFPIGYVDSMEAAGVKVKKVAVAIAPEQLQNGLLGHDFFGKYDITIKSNVVEFRPRSDSEIPQQKTQKETRKSIPIYPKKLFEE